LPTCERANIHHNIHYPGTQHAVGSRQSAVTRKGTSRREEVLKSKIPFADFSKNRNPKNKEKPPKRRVRPDLSDYPRLIKEERKNRDILIK
jgi:hypothetical protein